MSSSSIILYFLGLIGVSASILILGFKIHKKKKVYNIFALILIITSFTLLGAGTILSLINIKKSSKQVRTSIEDTYSSESNNNISPIASYSDLSFIYRFSKTSVNNIKQAYITINNTSNFIFNGSVHLRFLNSNNNEVSTMTIPVKNLVPNNSTKSTVQVNSEVDKIEYSFNGEFIQSSTELTHTYKIKNISVGGELLSFEVITDNKDIETLDKICKEFKDTYSSSYCKGFLIYFIDDETKSFNNAFGDFYGDHEKSIYNLTIYDNKEYKIR